MAETLRWSPSHVLRTCYRDRAGDAARHQWLLNEYVRWAGGIFRKDAVNETGEAEEFMNDASRYDFGAAYERIFDFCPDLLFRGRGWIRVKSRQEQLNRFFKNRGDYPIEPAQACRSLARASIINWIQVEDEAFLMVSRCCWCTTTSLATLAMLKDRGQEPAKRKRPTHAPPHCNMAGGSMGVGWIL